MIGKTNAANGKPTQIKTLEFNPGSADSIAITPDEGHLLSSVEVKKPMTMIPENIKKDVNIGGVIGTHEGGITIQPVTNLTLSNKGVLSWTAPDISELTSQGYTVTLSYDVYVNDELKTSVTNTSVALEEYLVEGENNIKVIAKAEVKYFESNGNEIVESWAAKVTVTTLSATLPTAIGFASNVVINDKVYIFGGSASSGKLNTIIEFDPATNAVTTLSKTLPNAADNSTAAAINNKAYIFGGYNSNGLNTIVEFDPATNTVTTLSSTLPAMMFGSSAVAINSKAYIFGGSNPSHIIVEFDPATNTATQLSSKLPSVRFNPLAVAINDKAYAFSYSNTGTIAKFDPTTYTVTTLSAKLTGKNNASAVAINDKAYILGGTATIVEFDPSTGTITTLDATLPIAGINPSAAVVNSKAYVFGGYKNGYLDAIVRIDNLG